jgi:hypothetical protein
VENRIIAIEANVKRHEDVIEALRAKLDEIHAGLSRVEAGLNSRGQPGVSEFCRQHMQILTTLGERLNAIDEDVSDIDRELTTLKVRLYAWVAAVVVLVNVLAPYIRKLLGLP